MTVKKEVGRVILRMSAVFIAAGSSVLVAGNIVGVEAWQAVAIAGISAVAAVVKRIATAYIADGTISAEELDSIFSEAENDVSNTR